jgi:hypothetical protein
MKIDSFQKALLLGFFLILGYVFPLDLSHEFWAIRHRLELSNLNKKDLSDDELSCEHLISEEEGVSMLSQESSSSQAYSFMPAAFLSPQLQGAFRFHNKLFQEETEDEEEMDLSSTFGGLKLIWPILGRVSSHFGMRKLYKHGHFRMHSGIDISQPIRSPIRASEAGVVKVASLRRGYGKTIIIDHREGYSTLYAHLNHFTVLSGQYVQKGQVIGFVGRTGRSTGPHLHFETRIQGRPIDPMTFLPLTPRVNYVKKETIKNQRKI